MVYHRWYQPGIFEMDFGAILDPHHELVLLSQQINWEEIIDRLLPYYSKRGSTGKEAAADGRFAYSEASL